MNSLPEQIADGARDRTILAAGERQFAARGFAGASTRAIATDVGLNQATLYHYYPTKRALYEAVLSRAVEALLPPLEDLAQRLEASPDPSITPDALAVAVDRTVDYLEAHPQLALLVLRASLDGEGLEGWRLSPALRPLYEVGIRIVTALRTQWEPDELPLVVISLYQLVLGHFASMPLWSDLLERNAASRSALEQQKRFWKRLLLRLLADPHDL